MESYTVRELIPFIEATGESAHIDAKGPIKWDSGEAAARLTKDIISFANSHDGSVIVIGKTEVSPGKFVLSGVTADQADSFETTKVSTWINNRFSPPVNLVCHRVQHAGNEFIVITVAEFNDIPIFCTKSYQLPGKPPKFLLRQGAIYIRTANAESDSISYVEDWRRLIGFATTKHGNQTLSMFQSMMQGQLLLQTRNDEEYFLVEKNDVREVLDSELDGEARLGAWMLTCYPTRHDPSRWDEAGVFCPKRRKGIFHDTEEFSRQVMID